MTVFIAAHRSTVKMNKKWVFTKTTRLFYLFSALFLTTRETSESVFHVFKPYLRIDRHHQAGRFVGNDHRLLINKSTGNPAQRPFGK